MKNVLIIIICVVVSSDLVKAQLIYYDAIKLSKIQRATGRNVLPNSNDTVYQILQYYVPIETRGNRDAIDNVFNLREVGQSDPNPFIEIGGGARALTPFPLGSGFSNKIGGL